MNFRHYNIINVDALCKTKNRCGTYSYSRAKEKAKHISANILQWSDDLLPAFRTLKNCQASHGACLNCAKRAEWEKRIRAAFAQANELRERVFINTIPAFYNNIAEAVTSDYPRANGERHIPPLCARLRTCPDDQI